MIVVVVSFCGEHKPAVGFAVKSEYTNPFNDYVTYVLYQLMTLHTVTVYNLRISMKEDNPGSK